MAMDSSQHSAVFQPIERSTLVIAPPGYGKTYVMTRRIAYLLQEHCIRPPKRILGLTFTNAAAGEMMRRVRTRVVTHLLDFVSIMTFHSFCYDLLGAYGNHIGIEREFAVIGQLQQQDILFELFEDADVQLDRNRPWATPEIRDYENWLKERKLRLREQYRDPNYESLFQDVYQQYLNRLGNDSLDFNHILLRARDLLFGHPRILELYRAAFAYVLVDEFQDTNPLQFSLLKLLVQGHPTSEEKLGPRSVFILADPNQAIYEFQGATPANVHTAESVFECDTICLKRNYRTESASIDTLSRIMRSDAAPSGAGEETEETQLLISSDPEHEAQRIVNRIQEYEGPLHEVCVVSQLSYRLYPIRDLLSEEEISIPFVFVPDFRARDVERNYAPIFAFLTDLTAESGTHGRLAARIRAKCQDIDADWNNDDVLKVLVDLAAKYDYELRSLSLGGKAREFTNDVMLDMNWGDLLRRNVRDKVFLSTIHGVKGLQFEQVHICGLVNFEHVHSRVCWPCEWGKNREALSEKLEEPFRALYVAITRAQEQLFLYATRKSYKDKQRQLVCLLEPLLPFLTVEGLRSDESVMKQLCGR